MKTLAAFAIAAAMTAAALPSQASGINFTLNDCAAGSALRSVTNACNTNVGVALNAVGSVVLPDTRIDGFGLIAAIVLVQTDSGTMPDWWRIDGCRAAAVNNLNVLPPASGACSSVWDGLRQPLAYRNIGRYPPYPPDPGNPRLFLVLAAAETDTFTLVGDDVSEFVVFTWTVLRAGTVGAGPCDGCASEARLVLEEIAIHRWTEFRIDEGLHIVEPVTSNVIVYNPATTPVRNRTWGAIKALYR
jgi:hypothetical protein